MLISWVLSGIDQGFHGIYQGFHDLPWNSLDCSWNSIHIWVHFVRTTKTLRMAFGSFWSGKKIIPGGPHPRISRDLLLIRDDGMTSRFSQMIWRVYGWMIWLVGSLQDFDFLYQCCVCVGLLALKYVNHRVLSPMKERTYWLHLFIILPHCAEGRSQTSKIEAKRSQKQFGPC